MIRFYSFLATLFLYLNWRLSPGLGITVTLALLYVFAGILLYPTPWLRQSEVRKYQHLLRWKVYIDIGLICFLSSFTIIRDLAFLPLTKLNILPVQNIFGASGSLLVISFAVIALIVGIWTAKRGPQVKSVKVPIRNLPDGLEGYRIVQISDLHVGPSVGSKYVKKVVEIVNSLLPNMTVLTGDIVDGHKEHHLPAVKHLGALEPAGQVMYVTGNHEFYWNGPAWISEFEKLGMHVLKNERRIIQHETYEILVAGILDPAAVLANPNLKPDLKAAMGDKKDSDVKILLAHQPNIAFAAEKEGFDLLLSGHTHAGQMFPFTLLIHYFQEFVRGLKACGKMWVYVNQGTGYWGPPIRLGTVTEITLLELTRQEAYEPRDRFRSKSRSSPKSG
jgi:hypothetical protein